MSTSKPVIIHWFRQDLRLADNPALIAANRVAIKEKAALLPIYILDEGKKHHQAIGGASRWWLHNSLISLNKSLNDQLSILKGDPNRILAKLINQYSVKAIYWNRCYEPWHIARDKELKQWLQSNNIDVKSFNGSLLWEPWEVLKKDQTPYRVFTPFYKRGCLNALAPRDPVPAPKNLRLTNEENPTSIKDLALLSKIGWEKKLEQHWQIGEQAAQQRLLEFTQNDISNYKTGRDFPAQMSTSRLSPHLHFGEISPNQAWFMVRSSELDANSDHFCSELAWREFSYSLLYHFPHMTNQNLQSKFDQFPWQNNKRALNSWQQGNTGYPIIDAGLRELWQTGYMHNRVRMIVGSFLVKNLLIDWRCGERWFWDCLLDADLANNCASWQWVAGCGADAAPFFRIFNPITQGKKFDPEGIYTRRFVPELKDLPDKYLFAPFSAPIEILSKAGITLGKTYPKPIVDLKSSRENSLAAFKSLS